MFFIWFRLFYFGRLFKSTAALVRMIVEIIKDSFFFLIILFLAILGFSNAYFLAEKINDSGIPMFDDDNSYIRSFLFTYRHGIGDF